MKTIVCLRDRVAGNYMQPFFVPAVGVASRTLADEIKKGGEGNILSSHPGDFELFRIGEFDDDRGVIGALERPEFLLNVSALVEVKDV